MAGIVNLKDYDLVFTTSFEHTHGISGHIYEMIEYHHVCSIAGIRCAVLLPDGTTRDQLRQAVVNKYDFDDQELSALLNHTFENLRPNIIVTRNLCITDGSSRLNRATVYADNAILLRCFDKDFSYFKNHPSIKRTFLLQDFDVYPERDLPVQTVDYVKKILWGRYRRPAEVKTETALLYLTTNCRALTKSQVLLITEKYSYQRYLILANNVEAYQELPDNIRVVCPPVLNIFENFDTYIYTSTNRKADCSPRFIVECAVFGKKVEYEIDYVDPGVEARKRAITNNLGALELTPLDQFVVLVKELI
jgi:hypothetical protein